MMVTFIARDQVDVVREEGRGSTGLAMWLITSKSPLEHNSSKQKSGAGLFRETRSPLYNSLAADQREKLKSS